MWLNWMELSVIFNIVTLMHMDENDCDDLAGILCVSVRHGGPHPAV